MGSSTPGTSEASTTENGRMLFLFFYLREHREVAAGSHEQLLRCDDAQGQAAARAVQHCLLLWRGQSGLTMPSSMARAKWINDAFFYGATQAD